MSRYSENIKGDRGSGGWFFSRLVGRLSDCYSRFRARSNENERSERFLEQLGLSRNSNALADSSRAQVASRRIKK